MEELINYLKIWYKNAIDNNDDMNAKSWGYEEGILITANEAKLIIDEWEAKLSDENSGLHKHVVKASALEKLKIAKKALNDIYNFDRDMELEYGDPGERAMRALEAIDRIDGF